MVECSQCKKEMGDLANYCNQCGTKLNTQVAAEDAAEKAAFEEDFTPENEGWCGPMGHIVQAAAAQAQYCSVCGEKFHFNA